MTKVKFDLLVKYQTMLKDRLTSEVPAKHKGHPIQYKNYLLNELRLVNSKLEAAKIEGLTK